MAVKLRPYQEDAFKSILKWMQTSGQSNLCVDMPTGSGKSHVIAYMCKFFLSKRPDAKILMMTHVKELLEQNLEKMLEYWPNAPVGMYSASVGKKQLGEAITFAGVQSIVKRMDEIGYINCIIIDECHLISHKDTGNYRIIIKHLKEVNPKLKVIGFTATPFRLGHGYIDAGSALFDEIIKPISVIKLIRDGFLSPLKSKSTKYTIDASKVRKQNGEYVESDLQKLVDTPENNLSVVDEIILRAQDRKSWLVFCTGVDHALSVRDLFREKGITAETVLGSTPKKERAKIIKAFKNGEITAITNANVLTTGFDAPNVDLIALLRPTMSTALHVQKLGRGTRLKTSGAEDCLVLDFVGNIFKHGGIAAPHVEETKKSKGAEDDLAEGEGDAPMKPCPECDEIVHIRCKVCTDCGYEFPPPEDKKGSGLVGTGKPDDQFCPITGDSDSEELKMNVSKWRWDKHTSKSSAKEMFKLTYFGSLSDTPISEYFTVTHEGYAGKKAIKNIDGVISKSGASFSVAFKSDDIEESCRYLNIASKPPKTVKYEKNGYFYRIKSREWQ